MKKLLIIALLVVGCDLLENEDTNKNEDTNHPIVGVWEWCEEEGSQYNLPSYSYPDENNTHTYTYNDDGTYSMTAINSGNESFGSGTYSINNNTIIETAIHENGSYAPVEFMYEINNYTLTITDSGTIFRYNNQIVGCDYSEPEPDCAGVMGGDAKLDNCGVCDTDLSNDCVQDCADVWGGNHSNDDCGIVYDNEGNSYKTIKIGAQTWMAENLKVTHYNNGDEISYSDDVSGEGWYDISSYNEGQYGIWGSSENVDIYGYLYNWVAVNDERGFCPDGFHVPSDEEWMELEMQLGMSEEEANGSGHRGTDEGAKLAGNRNLWVDDVLVNHSEFGTSGFNGTPAGYRIQNVNMDNVFQYYAMAISSKFWSSTIETENQNGYTTAMCRFLSHNDLTVYRRSMEIKYALNIRCVQD